MSQPNPNLDPPDAVQRVAQLEHRVAELEQSQRELRESVDRWQSVVQNSPDFIALVDRDLTISYLNGSAPDLDPKDMIGTKLFEYVLPEYHELVKERNEKVFTTGMETRHETSGLGPAGKIAWYASRLGPVRVNGEVVSVVHTVRNITERKLAEDALRDSEARIRGLLDAIPDAILRFSREGICLEYKPARADGYAGLAGDAVGKSLAEILPTAPSSQALICFKRAFDEDSPQRFEFQIEHGSRQEIRCYEARFVTSSVDEALVIIHDITQRRQAEQAALTTEIRFRQLVERAPVCIFQVVLVALTPIILTANRRAEMVYGMTQDEFKSCRLTKLFAPKAIADLNRLVMQAGLGQTLTMESRHRSADGRIFPVRISAAPEAVTAAKRMILTVEDITVEKQRRSEIEAIEQERRRIAHEIHDGLAQDLSALRLRSALWHDLVDTNPDRMHTELDELSVILKSCIGEVRHSIFALRPVVLDELGFLPAIRQLLLSFANLYNLQPRFEMAGPVERIDPSSELPLFRVIQESLNNVGQHAKATSVTITLDMQAVDVVTVTIEDDGVGIRQSAQHRPPTENHYGLQHMRERMESMGGSFSIESELGQGTRVRAVLPLNLSG